MNSYPFIFTILFMLLGPLKTIGPFAKVTQDVDVRFQRAVAIRATLIAAILMAFVVYPGGNLLNKYHISSEALNISGGLVLLVAALRTIFNEATAHPKISAETPPLKAAASPVATPIVVTTAGVAAILIFTLSAPRYPGMMQVVIVSLAIILVLNFLAMYFNRAIVSIGPLMLVLQLLGAVLVFIQVALAVDTMLSGFRGLGLLQALPA